jgi:hypothetical protein
MLGGAAAGNAQPAGHAGSRASITLRSGRSFRPTLGDWEGTVNGLPASFALSYGNTDRSQPYGIADLVAVRPAACPARTGHNVEDVIAASVAAPLGAYGALGLGSFGLGGSLSGARSATLTRAAVCGRTLSWNMHPASRRAVTDGVWTARYSGGGSTTFHVVGGGRLATAFVIPTALTRCNGLAGKLDIFVGPRGTATLSQSGLRVSIAFGRRSGSGRINSDGSGCAGGPFRFSVTLKKAG